VPERFLIDECLSPLLAALARERGHVALHLAHIGRMGSSDYQVLRLMLDGGYVFVTNNARDFRRLLATVPIHGGLIVVMPSAKRPRQRSLFSAALDFIERMPDIINKVIEVHAEDDIRISNLPGADA
jgi:hypothetical protein